MKPPHLNRLPLRSSPLSHPVSPFTPRSPLSHDPPQYWCKRTTAPVRKTRTPQGKTRRASPRVPLSWVWKCHSCRSMYPLGATRRCLHDGHRFCSGGVTTLNSGHKSRHQPCGNEFDFEPWADFGDWRRWENATLEAHGPLKRDIMMANTLAKGTSEERQKAARARRSNAESMYKLKKTIAKRKGAGRDCWALCDYPSECRHGPKIMPKTEQSYVKEMEQIVEPKTVAKKQSKMVVDPLTVKHPAMKTTPPKKQASIEVAPLKIVKGTPRKDFSEQPAVSNSYPIVLDTEDSERMALKVASQEVNPSKTDWMDEGTFSSQQGPLKLNRKTSASSDSSSSSAQSSSSSIESDSPIITPDTSPDISPDASPQFASAPNGKFPKSNPRVGIEEHIWPKPNTNKVSNVQQTYRYNSPNYSISNPVPTTATMIKTAKHVRLPERTPATNNLGKSRGIQYSFQHIYTAPTITQNNNHDDGYMSGSESLNRSHRNIKKARTRTRGTPVETVPDRYFQISSSCFGAIDADGGDHEEYGREKGPKRLRWNGLGTDLMGIGGSLAKAKRIGMFWK